MRQGLEFYNNASGVVLSAETTPLCMHNRVTHTLTRSTNPMVLMNDDDGYISVYSINADNIMNYGVFSPFGAGDNYYILADRLSADASIDIDEYKFKLGINQTAQFGLQLFDENGVETYNSNNKIINILEHYSLNVADCWLKNDNGGYTGQYTNKILVESYQASKIGILFTKLPTGFVKFSNSRHVYAYDIRFSTVGGWLTLMYWVQSWTQSFSSVHVPVDESIKLEFFVVDLSNMD